MWYVIQTLSSKEKAVKDFIDRHIPSELYDDSIIVYYETEKKYQGSWHKEMKRMFPGYLC